MGALDATEASLLLGPLRSQRKEICMCLLTTVYMPIYKYFYSIYIKLNVI